MKRCRCNRWAARTVAALCLAALLGASGAARASEGDWSGLVAAVYLLVGGSVVVSLGGAVVGVQQARYVNKGEQAPLGWRISGAVFAALNLGAGGLWLAATGGEGIGLGMGFLHLAVGAFDLTLTIWSSKNPEGPRLSLAPTMLLDARDRPSPGAALQLASW